MFSKALPVALSMGMTPGEFWDGDPWLFAAYREAREMRADRGDWERWQSGSYVYEALLRASAVLNPFSTGEAPPWVEAPYGHDATQDGHGGPEEDERAAHQRFAAWIMAHGPQ